MKWAAFLTLGISLGAGIAPVLALQVSKKGGVTKTRLQAQPATERLTDSPSFFLFPEFYSFWPVNNNDTVLKYECADIHDSLINTDTLHNVDEVRHILLTKTYTDYTRTYIDPDGKPQPMPVQSKVYKYDKVAENIWEREDYATKEKVRFKEYRNEIVRSDTTSETNPMTGNKLLIIRKYYKVELISQ